MLPLKKQVFRQGGKTSPEEIISKKTALVKKELEAVVSGKYKPQAKKRVSAFFAVKHLMEYGGDASLFQEKHSLSSTNKQSCIY